ncbi:hypothetical protein PGT21_032848 [Puccinia graminis f. sp. tritici]|uniref:Uncharacterized protein n=2 Tax=Puccinia graminis f. sp. tritici TaxID=56615 RepID=A0A5B0PBY0_PUCGR|nr:hypothetical protein PGT21_032848 [Puccinia graminis f. sp. tritici]
MSLPNPTSRITRTGLFFDPNLSSREILFWSVERLEPMNDCAEGQSDFRLDTASFVFARLDDTVRPVVLLALDQARADSSGNGGLARQVSE